MEDLTNLEVKALGRAVGLDIQEPELTEVAHSLNAILEMMDEIDPVSYTHLTLPTICSV